MPQIHLFFPENDLALAKDTAVYTAPPTVVKLRRAGATLPLWYGSPGDYAIIDGINARWHEEISRLFNINVTPYSQYLNGIDPMPWGWSKASRRLFELKGVPAIVLPNDAALSRIRDLSHRRTAAEIGKRLEHSLDFRLAPAARELFSVKDVKTYVGELGKAVVKLPWSSSGRGIIPVEAYDFEKQCQAIEGAIRRQGSVMVEPLHDKVLDFAVLFELSDGRCSFQGLSVFETSGFGSYAGNILAPTDYLRDKICNTLGGTVQFDAVISALPPIIEDLIGNDYSGALGIDMMAVKGDGYTLAPTVELNLRMTMGHVCHRFYRDYVTEGRLGSFRVTHSTKAGMIKCDVGDAGISQGTLDLAQPGSDFSFIIDIHQTI